MRLGREPPGSAVVRAASCGHAGSPDPPRRAPQRRAPNRVIAVRAPSRAALVRAPNRAAEVRAPMTCGTLAAIAAGCDTAFTVDASRVTFGPGALAEAGDRA